LTTLRTRGCDPDLPAVPKRVHAALAVCPGSTPLEADVRWRQPMTGRTGFRLRCRLAQVDASRIVVESRFLEADVECAEMRITLGRSTV